MRRLRLLSVMGFARIGATIFILIHVAQAQPNPAANPIVAENARTDGVVSRARWDRQSFRTDPNIGSVEGFSTQFSVGPGETLHFKVKTPPGSTSYHYEIYRLGWYGGAGARQVFPACNATQPDPCPRISIIDNPVQPVCSRFVPGGTGLDVPDCANWQVSPDPNASWQVSANAVSGVYIARLSAPNDPEDVTHIPFVVREAPGVRSEVLYQLGDSTWQAYNNFNDSDPPQAQSFYDAAKQAVSYNRPWQNRAGSAIHGPKHFFFDLDLPLIRFLEQNGISVGYLGSADLEAFSPEFPLKAANPLFGRKVYLANGHEEYWQGKRLQNLKFAAESGTSMLFLCANTAYYKTRFISDSSQAAGRVQIAYKEGTTQNDPLRNDSEWTGVYRDTRPNPWDPFSPAWTRPPDSPAGSANSLTGVTPAAVNLVAEFGNPGNVPATNVPVSMHGLRTWRNTICATSASPCSLGVANVGFEMDLRADRYFEPFVASQPAGLFSVAATIIDMTGDGLHADSNHGYAVKAFADIADYSWPHATVEATMYRNSAGALIFATSSFRWSHGLDDARSTGNDPSGVSHDMQQATINILADMHVQPGSLMPGLQAATASTDHTAPVSHILELNQAAGIVTGVASDADGAVAGVEISFDLGKTWRGAALSEVGPSTSWSFVNPAPAHVNPLIRAVDDSGNIERPHGPDNPIPPSDGQAVTTIGVAGLPSVSGVLTQTIAPAPDGSTFLTPGWTSLVAIDVNGDGLTDLLSYNAVTGAAISETSVAGFPGRRNLPPESVASEPGWTSLVPMNIHGEGGVDISDLLFYNAATGRAYYSVGLHPGVTDIANAGGFQPFMGFQAAPGFTSIVPMNINGDALTDLLWYNSATGLALYTVGTWHKASVDGDGVVHLTYYSQDLVSVRDAAPGWTSIVPMRMNNDALTDLLSYNAATGLAVYSIGNGISQTIVNTVNAAPGFTSIVPFDLNGDGLTDLLSYNAATGLGFYSIATGLGVQKVVGPAAQGATGWTSIVPMKLTPDPKGMTRGMTDLMFYR